MHDPAWLDRTAYPFTSRFWSVPGGEMHYIDVGDGAPIVFVHGVPTWSFSYRNLIPPLAAHYRCIAGDHLGFGLSSKPPDWSYAPEALARNLELVIDGLGLQQITLVVHDWGGPLGLAYAVNNPANVRRIVLFNSWLWPASVDLRTRLSAWLLASPLMQQLERRGNALARWFIPLASGDRRYLTPSIHRHYIAPLQQPTDRGGTWALARAIQHSSPWLEQLWQQRQRIAAIPVLILWGLRDPAFSRQDLQRWRKLFTQAEVTTYPHLGHFPYEEDAPLITQRILTFLQVAP